MSLYGIGTEIQVEMTNSGVHIGRVYSYDEESNLLVLFKCSDLVRDFIFLSLNHVKKVSIIDPWEIDYGVQDIEKFIKEVDKRTRKDIKTGNANTKVSSKIQGIFNEFSKTYQCEWDTTSIVIPTLGIVVKPPYMPASVEGPDVPRKRISTILVKIREKLEIK